MADYVGQSRSNYFRVKDREAFEKWAASCGLQVEESAPDSGLVGIFYDGGSWPLSEMPADTGDPSFDFEEHDVPSELQDFLQEGEVAILMDAGWEKLRYISGYAVAVTPGKPLAQVCLQDIYDVASKAFDIPKKNITACEY
jgi:hypothetical protein